MKRSYEILERPFNASLLLGKSWRMNSAVLLTLMKEATAMHFLDSSPAVLCAGCAG
ncbi:MAG: hypothetical protein JWR69_1501 [Pedosphaera sp.]|nr:hypothetical protein [Pedosphaera sp.]